MRILLLLVVIMLLPAQLQAALSVWTESILNDKADPSYDPASKPTSYSIKGAKGEWLAFQVLARPASESGTNAWVPSVQSTLTSGSHTIADSNIDFYLIHYVDTAAEGPTYSDVTQTEWPDACVPYQDRFYGETRNGTEAGWGQSIADNDTQPFLVEIYIPSDADAGIYTGTVRLSATGATSGALYQDISITLTVWDFTVPLKWSYPTSFGMDDSSFTSAGMSWDVASDQLAKSGVDHGIWSYGAANYVTPSINTTTGAADFTGKFADTTYGWKRWLDGTVANDSDSPRPYYGFIPGYFEMRSTSWVAWIGLGGDATKIDKWFDDWDTLIFDNNYGDNTKFFAKTQDEATTPSCCTTEDTITNYGMSGGARTYQYHGQTVGVGATPAGCLPFGVNGCTETEENEYQKWWIVSDMMGFVRLDYDDARNAPRDSWDVRLADPGDEVWIYSANTANMDYDVGDTGSLLPSMYIDTYVGARENAALPLEMWIFDVTGFHYWYTVKGFNSGSAGAWNDTDLGDPAAQDNGDGQIWYFGDSTGGSYDIGGTNDILVESYRMKLWRYGMNILEYATLLKDAGKSSVVDTQIANMVTVPETGVAAVTWGSVSEWETAREAMATELLGPVICYTDGDGDGEGAGTGTERETCLTGEVTNNLDCDDTDGDFYSTATQVCGNGLDEQTCGVVDDTCGTVGDCGSEAAQVDTRSYPCTVGTSSNQVNGTTTTTWDCVGTESTDSCSAAYSETVTPTGTITAYSLLDGSVLPYKLTTE